MQELITLFMNIEWQWWWFLLLLPLPLLIYTFVKINADKVELTFSYLSAQTTRKPDDRMRKILAILIWIFLLLAAARPTLYGPPINFNMKYRDLMLVVDLSGSMQEQDMQYNNQLLSRLNAVKEVLTDFVSKRNGDRLGLVVFADHAYLQTPITADRTTVISQLKQMVVGLIGHSTAIGDGIGIATKTLIDTQAEQRVIILLSDGKNTAGVLDPIEASNIAKKYNTTIYTIGIGAGEMVVKDFFGTKKVNTAADLDESTLTQVASITGGQYFRAHNFDDLQKISETIEQLEPISSQIQTWRAKDEWFIYPLALAFLCSILLALLLRRQSV